MLDILPPIVASGLAILIGFVGLIWSADRLVGGAAAIAGNFGIAPMVIGLTIVSFGTSAPEIMVSLEAAFQGSGELAIGNAIGSNIANIGLVLGFTTLVASIPVQKHLLQDEAPILLIATAIGGLFLFDGKLNATEGWILLGLLIPSIWYLIYAKQKHFSNKEIAEEEEQVPSMKTAIAVFWLIAGLAILALSSKVLVWGAVGTAEYFEVSPLIIGLTVIAIGTSLPELAASLVSAIKGHHDIAVGNIIGSNLFNLLAVMSLPGIIGSVSLEASVFWRDYACMLLLTVLLLGITIWLLSRAKSDGDAKIGRVSGALLLSVYIGYLYLLVYQAVNAG